MSFLLKSRITSGVLLLVTVFVFAKNFWLNEDAYIIFRSLEQLQAGNGAVWNAGERVQVYTSVAWYWLLAGVNALTHDVFTTTIGVTIALFAMLLMMTRRLFGDTPSLWFVLVAALLSKGFFDYTSSGLENILAYVVLLALYGAYRSAMRHDGGTDTRQHHYLIATLTGLLPLVRHDLALLGALPFAVLLWRQRRRRREVLGMVFIALAPLALWTLASLVYYGLPLPNTAYAKLKHGFDSAVALQSGADYFYWNARLDPLTMLIIVVAPLISMVALPPWQRGFAIGIVLYGLYLYQSGGDYMAGRFLSFPFLVGTLLIADWLKHRRLQLHTQRKIVVPALAAVVAYLWLVPNLPLLTPWTYGHDADPVSVIAVSRARNALDQRQLHYQTTLAAWWRDEQRMKSVLEMFRKDGELIKQSGDSVAIRGAVGTTGYYAGIDVHIVDFFALTDPFLAQLPAIKRHVSGHFEREIVAGYIDHLRDGSSPIQDAALNQYYQHIELLTRSPELLSLARLQCVVAFNLGHYDNVLDAYRHEVAAHRATAQEQKH